MKKLLTTALTMALPMVAMTGAAAAQSGQSQAGSRTLSSVPNFPVSQQTQCRALSEMVSVRPTNGNAMSGFSLAHPVKQKSGQSQNPGPLRITGDDPAYGCVVWASSWVTTMKMDFGIYSIPTNGMKSLNKQVSGSQFSAGSGAVYTPKKYFTAIPVTVFDVIVVDMDYYIMDPDNWEIIEHVGGDLNFSTSSMVYDPTTGMTYAYYADVPRDCWCFGTFDMDSYTFTPIKDFEVNRETQWIGMVVDNAGVLHAISYTGDLYKVDKTTGETELLGNIGVTSTYVSSTAYNPKNGKCYMTKAELDYGALYEVDLKTATATHMYDFEDGEQVRGMFFYLNTPIDGAPATPTDLTLDFNNGDTDGTISFGVPATTFDGTPASGNVEYEIALNGKVVANGTTTYGSTETVNVSVPEAALYTVGVSLINEAGRSILASVKEYIGSDLPTAVTGLQAAYSDNQVEISWEPSVGVDGGYLNYDKVTYTVVRMPEGVTVAENIKETSCVDKIEDTGKVEAFYYEVTANFDEYQSPVVKSDIIVIGHIVPPYVNSFDTEADFNCMSHLGGPNPFKFSSKLKASVYTYYGSPDVWLITPPVEVKAGMTYKFSIDVRSQNAQKIEKYEICAGNKPTAEDLSDIVIPKTEVTDLEWRTDEGMYEAKEDGFVYFGVHCVTEPGSGYFFDIDNISISAPMEFTSPAAASDVIITPAADGTLKAEISFTAPSLDINGGYLSSLDYVIIKRNGKEIAKVNAKPGETVTYSDNNADGEMINGLNTYSFIGVNDSGEGEALEVSQFIGFGAPAACENLETGFTTAIGEINVSWDAVTTDEAGRSIPADLTSYELIRISNNGETEETVYEGKELSYTDKVCDAETSQIFVYYALRAKAEGIDGISAYTMVTPVGKPYASPWSESFPDRNLTYRWGGYSSGKSTWGLFGDIDISGMISADADNGMLVMYSDGSTVNDSAEIYSGLIEIGALENPGFSFYFYGYSSENIIEAMVNDGTGFQVKRTISIGEGNGWTKVVIDLAEYAGKFIQVGFRGTIVDNPVIGIDNIKVTTLRDYNLEAGILSCAERVRPNEDFSMYFTYANDGMKVAENYDVVLYRNGEEIIREAGKALAAGTNTTVAFTTQLSVLSDKTNEFHVELDWNLDEVKDNNYSKTAEVTLITSDYPVVDDLKGEIDGDGNPVLSWSDPDTSLGMEVPSIDGAEDYPAFSNGMPGSEIPDDSLGEWSVIDGDGNPTYNIDSYYFPNENSPMAWMVFNNSEVGLVNYVTPHSGEQMFVCFSAIQATCDDWLISPELSGKAQTISFFAKTALASFGLEKFEVYYSTTGREKEDFVLLKDVEQAPENWKEYFYDLPEGAKYFAIRCVSTDSFVLCVDDISFVKADADRQELAIVGYNVYRDNILVNAEPVVENSFVDVVEDASRVKYVVTVVYDLGESSPSNEIEIVLSGVDATTATVRMYAEGAELVILGADAQDITVVAANGVTVWRGIGQEETRIPAASGIYVVKVGDKSAKIRI